MPRGGGVENPQVVEPGSVGRPELLRLGRFGSPVAWASVLSEPVDENRFKIEPEVEKLLRKNLIKQPLFDQYLDEGGREY